MIKTACALITVYLSSAQACGGGAVFKLTTPSADQPNRHAMFNPNVIAALLSRRLAAARCAAAAIDAGDAQGVRPNGAPPGAPVS
jgi:hypothetical protein